MSIQSRRAILTVSVTATLLSIAAVGTLRAQRAIVRPAVPGAGPGLPGAPAMPGQPPRRTGYDLGNLTLPKDDDLKEKIEAAMDRIKEKDWRRACDTLQALVGRPEDVFVPITRTGPNGEEQTGYVSVKKEAARLISTMPKPGRDTYEAIFGERASTMVKRARTNNDRVEMAQAMSLYLYTEAGADAANWLGTYHLDRAEFQAATRYFQQLIQREGIRELHPRTLLKAAYAFHQAGDKVAREETFRELDRRSVEIKLREDTTRTVADLRESIDRMIANVSQQSASDSPMYRGRPNRTATLPGGTPFLEPAWKSAMVRTEQTREKIKLSETQLQSLNQPILTSFVPVTATMTRGESKIPLLIYRNFWGLNVLNMTTGNLVWDSPSDWSLDNILGADSKLTDASKKNAYNNWLSSYQTTASRPQILFENSVLATISADNKNVYAIEDLAVPPPPMPVIDPRFGGSVGISFGKEVNDAIQHNKLQAFDLSKDGKLAWEIGGRDEKDPLSDTYFLGAPLPLNGRLYVLTEKQQEIRLATLEPSSGRVLGMQTLAATKDLKLSQDPMRRIQACHLAYGEGILVVPTNAGAVFGVDLLSNSLLWAYPYRNKDEVVSDASSNAQMGGAGGVIVLPGGRIAGRGAVPAGMIRTADGRLVKATTNSGWMVTAPAVVDGKVVFTAPDAPEIHCVSLRDGTRLWSLPREQDDLYLAGVYHGKVVIVGKKRTRAINLTRGDKVWELETGVPSGQGAAGAPNALGEIIYYLPVREAVNSREPEICAINLDRGLIHAHTRSRKKEIPGNLIFYEGNVLSQTHTQVVAYPQLEIKLAQMDRLVKNNPTDPVALTDRGDYLLDKGDLGGAINDFRKALDQSVIPPATKSKARAKLYDAFTEYFQRDFVKAEEFIREYEELCRIDLTGKTGAERTALEQEARRRRANFLCLVGKGREGQNRLVDAFEKYLELGLEAKPDELIQVVDEPSVKAAPDVWSQGRIASMVANAQDPKQKKALEDLINQRWSKLKTSPSVSLDELRKFVSLFGSLFGVGKEARLVLAERLMEDPDVGSLLEAEQQLSILRAEGETPEVAARALEALARLNTRKGLLEDAAYYYRLLGERYPNVNVEGRLGSEYLEDLATDKRFLPYVDQSGRFVIKGKVELKSTEDRTFRSSGSQTFQFAHDGEGLPFFTRHKLALQMDWSHQLKLLDVTTGEERWKPALNLTRTKFNEVVAAISNINPQGSPVKFAFQSQGHLIVLQLGHMVFGIDPMGKGRVLWERNLSSLPDAATTPPSGFKAAISPRDNTVTLQYHDGWVQRLGDGGPLQGGIVCMQMRDQLLAIDPVTGRTLWSRSDVTSRARVFGDDQYVYVVSVGDNDNPSGTRIFRAYDGVSVNARDFSDVYQHRIHVQGRNILAAQTDAKKQLTLRLYDVVKGQDTWKRTFPAGTIQLTSEDPNLAGVAEPNGTIRVTDVVTGREVLNAQLADPKHLAGATEVYLVSDPDYFFVAINGPADPNLPAWAKGPQRNVQTMTGLRSVPVHGMVYCFQRKTGKINWYNPVENQQMIVSQFDELPAVFFTARYQVVTQGAIGRGNVSKLVQCAQAIAKHNGKLWYDNPDLGNNSPYFDSLTMDHRTGRVELSSQSLKITLTSIAK